MKFSFTDRIGHGAYAPIASSEPDMTVSRHTAQAFAKARLVDEPDCSPLMAQSYLYARAILICLEFNPSRSFAPLMFLRVQK